MGNRMIQENTEMSVVLNDYFLSVFTQEDLLYIPEANHIFQGRSEKKLRSLKVPFHQSRVLHKLLRTFCAELFLCTYKRTPLVDHVSTD